MRAGRGVSGLKGGFFRGVVGSTDAPVRFVSFGFVLGSFCSWKYASYT